MKIPEDMVTGPQALDQIKMQGGDELNAVYRNAFMVHASLTEIIIDFGTLSKSASGGQAQARERIAMCPAVAMNLIQALSRGLDLMQQQAQALSQNISKAMENRGTGHE